MTPTNDQKMRVVAEKLGMWKEGQRCVTPVSVWEELFGASTSDAHDIPPPNFLEPAGADMLEVALLARAIRIFKCQVFPTKEVFVTLTELTGRSKHATAIDHKRALLDVAFKLLGENADD